MLLDALASTGFTKSIPVGDLEQYELLFELTRWAAHGLPVGPVSILEELYRLVTTAVWRATIWPGLEVTWFMLGAFIHYYRPVRLPTAFETQDIADWYFKTFLKDGVNDRFLTDRQRKALAAPIGGARAPALAIEALHPSVITSRSVGSELTEASAQDEPVMPRGLFKTDYTVADGHALAPGGETDSREPAASTVGRVLRPSEIIFFGANGNRPVFALPDSWNQVEPEFSWCHGESGIITFQFAADAKSFLLDADIRLIRDGKPDHSRFSVLLNGHTIYEQPVLVTRVQRVLVVIDQPMRPMPALNVLIFRVDRPYFPFQWGSEDDRCLGAGVERLWIHANV